MQHAIARPAAHPAAVGPALTRAGRIPSGLSGAFADRAVSTLAFAGQAFHRPIITGILVTA